MTAQDEEARKDLQEATQLLEDLEKDGSPTPHSHASVRVSLRTIALNPIDPKRQIQTQTNILSRTRDP